MFDNHEVPTTIGHKVHCLAHGDGTIMAKTNELVMVEFSNGHRKTYNHDGKSGSFAHRTLFRSRPKMIDNDHARTPWLSDYHDDIEHMYDRYAGLYGANQ